MIITHQISIIVAIYNSAKWIRKCIESLLGQSYRDYELIMVDDGSFDLASAICDEYSIDDYINLCKRYKTIKELDRDIVDDFIDTIYIYDKKIEIIFKYNDIYKSLLERDESYE